MSDLPALILVGILQLTSYRSVKEQTDSTPFITSIEHRTHPFGAAISRDLLKEGTVCYGDTVLIDGYGLFVINDAMGAYTYTTDPPTKQDRAIDIFVTTKENERLVGVQHRQVWVMRSPVRACNRTEAMTMAMVNAKKVRKALDAFKKQTGKEPTHNELVKLLAGDLSKYVKPHNFDVVKSDTSLRGK